MHARIYSKDLIDSVLAFFTGGNFENELEQYETDHPQAIINRLQYFDTSMRQDGATPFGVLYEDMTTYEMITLTTVQATFDFKIDFKDQGADLNVVRTNLYAYRDSVITLLKTYPDLNGICTECDITQVKPPLIMHKSGNYNGVIEIGFTVKFE